MRLASCYMCIVVTVLSLMAVSCATDLKENPDFNSLNKKVDRLEFITLPELESLRKDVIELQFKTGVAIVRPFGSPGTTGAGRPVPLVAPPVPLSAAPPLSSSMESLYYQGLEIFNRRDYEQAARIFRQILEQAPRDPLAPNARYWLGECYYNRRLFQEAIAEYDLVVRDYPASAKAPDAVLKTAYANHLLGNTEAAMVQLRNLLTRYPNSNAANMVLKGQTLFR